MTKTPDPMPNPVTGDAAGARLALDAPAARIAIAAVVMGAFAVGCSPIFVRLSELGPTATAFHRVFLALPALLLWNALENRRQDDIGAGNARPASLADHAGLALAGAFFAGDLAFWHWSIIYTSVANATVLANFAPIFVTLGAFLIFGERFSKTFLVGLALAVVGAGVLMADSITSNTRNLLGDAFGLVTGAFFGAYVLTVGRLRRRFSAATIMIWGTLWTAVLLFPVAWLSGEGLMPLTARAWAVLIGLALVSQVGGQGLIAYALAHLPTAFSSVIIVLEAVFAAVLAWLLLGEALGPWQWLGAGIILAGIVAARWGSR